MVTGNPNPDCTGEYREAGTWSSKTYYKHQTKAYYVFYNGGNYRWYISFNIGETVAAWKSRSSSVLGTYDAVMVYAGNPVVEID